MGEKWASVSTRLSIVAHALDDIRERLAEMADGPDVEAARAKLGELLRAHEALLVTFIDMGERRTLTRLVLDFHHHVLELQRTHRAVP